MPRLKKKWMQQQQPAPPSVIVKSLTPYFRMKDGKSEAGIPFWTLYKLYQRGELHAAPLTPGGALYVKRSDLDALWRRRLEIGEKKSNAA